MQFWAAAQKRFQNVCEIIILTVSQYIHLSRWIRHKSLIADLLEMKLSPTSGHLQKSIITVPVYKQDCTNWKLLWGKYFPSQHVEVNSSRLQKLQSYSLLSVCLCWSDTWLNCAIGKNSQTRGWLSCSDFHIYCLKPCGELSWMPIVELTHWNKHTSAASILQHGARTVFD